MYLLLSSSLEGRTEGMKRTRAPLSCPLLPSKLYSLLDYKQHEEIICLLFSLSWCTWHLYSALHLVTAEYICTEWNWSKRRLLISWELHLKKWWDAWWKNLCCSATNASTIQNICLSYPPSSSPTSSARRDQSLVSELVSHCWLPLLGGPLFL